ncbi:MAG: Gfo/Idh/MocA family oxidoreductase [Bacteroidales bacterium]|nr:Gfo/Idh/MocA family oxidoreductase [Bacteroidales bacterium]
MEKNSQSRRNFLKKSTLAATAITLVPRHVLGGRGFIPPSDKINLGFIGTGKLARGYFENFAELPEVHLLAGCDVNSRKLNNFKSLVDDHYSDVKSNDKYSDCKTFENYKELLELKEIDAVVIVTPDHWHAIPSIDAMKAGKDVFCEKPLAHTVYEGREMVKAARKFNRIVQTGSMQRSWRDFRHACELVYNGYLGEISQIIVNVGDPARECDLPEEPMPDNLNWDQWIGPAQMRPYNQILSPPLENNEWPMWRDYREFGGGILADWGAHMFDIAQWALGMDNSGPVHFIPPKDPSAVRGLKMIYGNGVELLHEDFERGYGVRFIGSEGTLDVSRSFLDSKPDNIAGIEIKSSDKRLYFSENHYQDWIDAIKKKSRPVADVETGHRSASVCNVANIAYRLNRELHWDPIKESFPKDKEANKLRTKKYRKPYSL